MSSERTKHLLACLAEEAGEVAQIVGKCLRFGMEDSHPKTGNIPNHVLMYNEVNDLIAVAEMLGIMASTPLINKKKKRVEEYIKYAEKALKTKIN